MNRSGFVIRMPVAGVLAAAAASGLVLAGCGSASGSGASSSSSPSAAGAPGSGTASSGTAGSVSTGSGAAAFFPLAVGNTWVYVDKLSGEKGTVSNQVVAVRPAASGNKITMKEREDLGGGPASTTTSALIVHPDGSISVPLTQMGSSSFKITSGNVIWPSAAELASGQPQHETLAMTMTMVGHTTTIKAHIIVKGAGTQSVHVPAGTYQATVIDETMSEKFAGFPVTTDIRTWVVNGIGPVKSQVATGRSGKDTVVTDEELKSFTKG